MDAWIRSCRSWIRLARGETRGRPWADQRASLISARQAGATRRPCFRRWPASARRARPRPAGPDEAQPILSEPVRHQRGRPGQPRRSGSPTAVLVVRLKILGRRDQARLVASVPGPNPAVVRRRPGAGSTRAFVTAAESLGTRWAPPAQPALARLCGPPRSSPGPAGAPRLTTSSSRSSASSVLWPQRASSARQRNYWPPRRNGHCSGQAHNSSTAT